MGERGDVQFIMTYLYIIFYYIIFISDYIIDLLIIWYLCIFCIYLKDFHSSIMVSHYAMFNLYLYTRESPATVFPDGDILSRGHFRTICRGDDIS